MTAPRMVTADRRTPGSAGKWYRESETLPFPAVLLASQIYPEQDRLHGQFRLPEPGVVTNQNAKRDYKLDSLSSPSPQINLGHLCLVASEL